MTTERVQAVAKKVSADTIPPEFIRSEADQPAITTFKGPIPDIPVVDLGTTNVVEAVAAASREWGFFQVVNHGVPEDLIKRLQSAGKEFYELPLEEKEKYAKELGAPGIDGYGSRLQKELGGKKAWVDHLFHKIWPPSAVNCRYWPQIPPYYREVNEEYATYMRQVGDKLFGALSLGLGLKEHALKEGMGGEDVQYNLKINFYPPCPCPELTFGVPPHTDLNGITILVPNEVQGLQVMKDDHWIDAKYIPNALIIHIGDQIEILSNGRYKSVLHRTTVNKKKMRISWPVFLEPPPELVVGPLPEMVSDENPAKFKTKKFKDYMHCKLSKIPH